MSSKVKQVIVMRRDTAPQMRAGKMVAQGSHASIAFLTRRMKSTGKRKYELVLSDVEIEWMESSFAKVCVKVESEEEFHEIHRKAKEAGLEVHMITDAGLTEFSEPTKTCLAIGPDLSSKIDPITGHLKLL